MKCPVCSNHEHKQIHLHSEGFHEGILECGTCGASWSINHGLTEVISDPYAKTFLGATAESVEGDDYSYVM